MKKRTVLLKDSIDSKILKWQADSISENKTSISASAVVNALLELGLKYGTKQEIFAASKKHKDAQ